LEVLEYFWHRLAELGWETYTDDDTNCEIIGARKPRSERSPSIRTHNYDHITTDFGYPTLELDLAPATSLPEAENAFREIMQLITSIFAEQNTIVLGYGIQPIAPPVRKYLGHKCRYAIICDAREEEEGFDLYPGKFPVGVHCLNAACQTHVEVSAGEAIPILNALNSTSGLRAAISANSAVWQNEIGDYKVPRLLFWDWFWPARRQQTGMPTSFKSLSHYVDYILDFRSVCIKRDQKFYRLDNTKPFRQFYFGEGEFDIISRDGERLKTRARADDLLTHQSLAWFDVRLNPAYGTIEDRVSCQQPPDAQLAVAALTLGLVENRDGICNLAGRLPREMWRDIRFLACKKGLEVVYPGVNVCDLVLEMLEVAQAGLGKREMGEEKYLQPLFDRHAVRCCPADNAISRFLEGGVKELVARYDMRNYLQY
jgi:gamma-glutamylcysteine synthetase